MVSRSWVSRIAGAVALATALVLAVAVSPAALAKAKVKQKKTGLANPKFVKIYFDIARALTQGRYSVALGYAMAGAKRYPRSGRMQFLLGSAYKSQKVYGKAIGAFRRATSLLDRRSSFYEKTQAMYNVALCLELSKQHAAALAEWQVYVRFVGGFPQEAASAAFARERIKALTAAKR